MTRFRLATIAFLAMTGLAGAAPASTPDAPLPEVACMAVGCPQPRPQLAANCPAVCDARGCRCRPPDRARPPRAEPRRGRALPGDFLDERAYRAHQRELARRRAQDRARERAHPPPRIGPGHPQYDPRWRDWAPKTREGYE
jgi:hypothetical protein